MSGNTPEIEYCNKCGCEIKGWFLGRKYIKSIPFCQECYYLMLGDNIDNHPLQWYITNK